MKRPREFLRFAERAETLLANPPHGFTRAPASPDYPSIDRYFRRQQYWGPYTMLRAYVSRMDGEIQLVLEEAGRSTLLCRTRDLTEAENILTKSRFRKRFPRIA